jgi:glycosyltransferase involved in cell wall biosynthesis
MNIVRVFSLSTHSTDKVTSGVDFLRIIQPMKHLNGFKNEKYEFEVTQYTLSDVDKTDIAFWQDAARNYDIFFFNYHTIAVGFAMMGCMARKYKRKLIMDIDDALWGILPDNPAYNAYKKGTEHVKVMTDILNEVDYATCTNNYLKNVIAYNSFKRHEFIKIIPNYIDLDLYKHRCTFKNTNQFVGLWFGSATHFGSLLDNEFIDGLGKVMLDYPNFTFFSIGSFIGLLRDRWGARYKQDFGDADLYKWVAKMPQFLDQADFMIVPIADNAYNRAKSYCKFLEASSAMIPGCYQNIRQYQDIINDGKNGFLCRTSDDWYKAITTLINNKELRQKMGQEAFKTSQDNTIQVHVKEYADFFSEILDIE